MGSLSEVRLRERDVCNTLKNRHRQGITAGPKGAMCGRLRVGKSFFHACSIGRCSHVFGLLVRFT
jgi:hypothetical protein